MARDNKQLLQRIEDNLVNYVENDPNLTTKEEYLKKANTYLSCISVLYNGASVNEEEKKYLIDQLLRKRISLNLQSGAFVSENFHSWLSEKKDSINFGHWNRYKKYLKTNTSWSEESITLLDTDSDKILDFLGDPTISGEWHRRGLMIGDIQAGKTANYTAIINKAADVGYKVIVVLTGMTENLRWQTQSRLDKEFVGYSNGKPLGVGQISSDLLPPYSWTTAESDFNINDAKSHNYPLGKEKVSLFVLKKNKHIINNLNRWLDTLRGKQKDKNSRLTTSLLLIDDECDFASVNTKDPDKEPTAINREIRSLLMQFLITSYLAVSATPFANIFINSFTHDEEFGDDLFPADYIYLLRAAERNPSYFGASRLFADPPNGDVTNCIMQIDEDDMNEHFPMNHKKTFYDNINSINDLPVSLIEVIRYFLLAQAIMDTRKGIGPNRSMLINISRYTLVQNKVKRVISDWLEDFVKPSVELYSKIPERINSYKQTEYEKLKKTWEKYNLETLAKQGWNTFSKTVLWKAVENVQVFVINQSKESDKLEYKNYTDSLRVIVIGGMSLSRGLTLENLVTSFFYRNTKAYDTLLQMGRWFGYRFGYTDIFKVWLSEQTIKWYQDINDASENLKQQIIFMNEQKLTPKDFGLRVKYNPISQLLITARNKMKAANKSDLIPITIVGRCIETPRIYRDPNTIEYNKRLVKNFILKISKIGITPSKTEDLICIDNGFWHHIPKLEIASFVHDFQADKFSMNYQSGPLSDYIAQRYTKENWDVGFAVNKESSYREEEEYQTAQGEVSVPVMLHATDIATNNDNIFRIGKHSVRVGSSNTCKIGLTQNLYRAIQEKAKVANRSVIDSDCLLNINRPPILIIYTVQLKCFNQRVQAIGLGFPDNGATRENEICAYYENTVAQNQQLELDFDEEEDEE